MADNTLFYAVALLPLIVAAQAASVWALGQTVADHRLGPRTAPAERPPASLSVPLPATAPAILSVPALIAAPEAAPRLAVQAVPEPAPAPAQAPPPPPAPPDPSQPLTVDQLDPSRVVIEPAGTDNTTTVLPPLRLATAEQVAAAEVPAAPEPPPLSEAAATTGPAEGLLGPDWVASRSPRHFTIQLQAGGNLDGIREVATATELPEPYGYYRMTNKGQPWYGLVVGDYASQAEARAAAQRLEALALGRPWIRSFGVLQGQLK